MKIIMDMGRQARNVDANKCSTTKSLWLAKDKQLLNQNQKAFSSRNHPFRWNSW